jgi:EAL domain-containing protein (putative c-di-GMP-specific phosphodiesterase class I)
MDLQTVGEYVESELTRKLLAKLGVDFAQGHFVGKPVPLDGVLSELGDTTLTSAV